ncbi:hypothetical protein [Mechercharimyces sp. CAU 1602]|uniref:hypothetical protein n=1 Tax=Mechercharimyces sp. CAU 1602 TaxID=2973933 RepID=UPI002163E8BE|nr:hypothetical protein [Mechercharimyces sp. CAU 1602]MCS1350876.1 hypothetical protein [Mechercharimyces sp. CAU 1602]
MVHIIVGDLLKSDCTVIGHQCNCFDVMGAGVAKQNKHLYPEAFDADRNFKVSFGEERLGKISYAQTKKRIIFNLYGQYKFGRKGDHTVIPMFEAALVNMMKELDGRFQDFDAKIGLPYKIGAGLAGGEWDDLFPIINRVSLRYKRDIFFV